MLVLYMKACRTGMAARLRRLPSLTHACTKAATGLCCKKASKGLVAQSRGVAFVELRGCH